MIRSTEDFRSLLKVARRAGTPLLAVRTADPASAMAQVSASLCGKTEAPVFAWDIMAGIAARNKSAKETSAHVFGEKAAVAGPADVLLHLHKGAAVKQFADAIVVLQQPAAHLGTGRHRPGRLESPRRVQGRRPDAGSGDDSRLRASGRVAE